LQTNKNEISTEFYKELKEKRKVDLGDYYNSFLQKKRNSEPTENKKANKAEKTK
jgi:hypothetical protein